MMRIGMRGNRLRAIGVSVGACVLQPNQRTQVASADSSADPLAKRLARICRGLAGYSIVYTRSPTVDEGT